MVRLPTEVKNFLFLQISNPVLVFIQPPIQRVQVAISLVGDDHSPRTVVEVQNTWRYTSPFSDALKA